MYGLNAVALVLFGCINMLAYRLCRCPEGKRKKAVYVLCALLLGGNLLRYGVIYPFVEGVIKIPAEFSTVAYFVVPLILLTGWERLNCWAAYSGLMTGFFYYMAMISVGGLLYGEYPPVDVYISLFCHGTLYFCGFITIASHAYRQNEMPKLLVGVGYVALRAALLRPWVQGSRGMLIYILLDALPVRGLLPERVWPAALPVYYGLLVLFLVVTARGFFQCSRRQYRKFDALRGK